MTAGEFKAFEKHVEKADVNDFVWWEGYSWTHLTDKQFSKIVSILDNKGFIDTVYYPDGKKYHKLPCGITLYRAKEV